MDTAILLFHQQLRRSIGEGKVKSYDLTTCLSTLSNLDPFQTGHVEYGFLWIADLLNSRYTEYECYSMAGEVVQLLGKHIDDIVWHSDPSWVSSLVSFLSLGERFYSSGSIQYQGLFALHILSSTRGNFDFTPAILPVLASILIPTHPLQSRHLALGVFRRFMVGRSYLQMKNVSNNRLDQLLRAVGDPFQFPDLPLQDGRPVVTVNYDPMKVVVILIGLASSDMWRNHLHRSNFASCEEILSTDEGRRNALGWVFDTAAYERPEFLCTPAEIVAAVRRLEELQCPNTAEVVILWAWTIGVVNVAGSDAWGLIERRTLNFYQTHGIRRLATLSRHITDTTMQYVHLQYLIRHPHGLWFRVRGHLVGVGQPHNLERSEVLRVVQACQLRRLYQLFGYDPATWKETVAVVGVDEKMGVFSGRSAAPALFTDWACDYP